MGFTPFVPTIGGITPPLPVLDGGTGATTPAAGLAALGGMGLQAATPVAGFALQNATPTILSWTAPNDGNQHRVLLIGSVNVTSAETGGAVTANVTPPGGGSPAVPQILAGGQAAGNHVGLNAAIVEAGSVVTVQQSALTVGAATAWVEIWGS
jgi:hypothetical protein